MTEVDIRWHVSAPVFDTSEIEFTGVVEVVAVFGTSTVMVESTLNGVKAPEDLWGSVHTESDVETLIGGGVTVGD